MAFISGLAFHKIAKWSYCPRYPMSLNPAAFKKNDIVFLNLDYYDRFMDVLKITPPKNRFILISHNSDKCFTNYHYEALKKITTQIYAINTVCQGAHVYTIPIGFRDMPVDTMTILKGIPNMHTVKDILIYMSFAIGTNPTKRTECYDTFCSLAWVTRTPIVPLIEYYNNIAHSKYVLSPEGMGVDCHRIYESIYFDSIPILKTSQMDVYYNKLPVVIVDSWTDVTEEFLNSNYERLYENLKQWKKDHTNWLQPLSWMSIKHTNL